MSGEIQAVIGIAVAVLMIGVFTLASLVDAVRGVGRSIDRLSDEVRAAGRLSRPHGIPSSFPYATGGFSAIVGSEPDVEAARRRMGDAGLGIGFSGGSVGAPRPPLPGDPCSGCGGGPRSRCSRTCAVQRYPALHPVATPPAEQSRLSWTQPCCDDCWDERNPEKPSPRAGSGPEERCCHCGGPTTSGIYVRVDPSTVAHPR